VAPDYDSGVHIYLHVPFCARRCSYCDFAIAVRRVVPDELFVAAIEREWRGAQLADGEEVATIYFGGGTPSRLDPRSVARLIQQIAARAVIATDAEITLEANPDDVSAERAAQWAAAGINRVSLGVQSHDPQVLQWMHRTHRPEQVPPAVSALRAAGITNISLDLIFALPVELGRNWTADLEQTLALEPAHLSLYGLTVEPHTPLAHWTERGSAVVVPDDRYAAEYLEAHSAITAVGLDHYEVSNAARPGLHSRHNSAYWSGAEYLGLGPSAHSFHAGIRRWNVREWADYQQRSAAGLSLDAGSEVLSSGARALERRYLELRTATGLADVDLPAALREAWCAAGWATSGGGRTRLTPEGWLRLDALVAAAPHS
jgi:putative oxygen-independent coproporphyrinogen III oxidase